MAECTAMGCPRLKNTDPGNRELSVYVSPDRITRDKEGHTWCNYCQKQRRLMDYGKEHKWPEVRAQGIQGRYAIIADEEEWYISMACGNQDLVDAFYVELIGNEQAAMSTPSAVS